MKIGLISGIVLLLLVSAATPQSSEIRQGDLDASGAIDSVDLVILANHLAGNLATIPAQFGQVYAIDPLVGTLRLVPSGLYTQGSPADEPCRNEHEAQFTHALGLDIAVMADGGDPADVGGPLGGAAVAAGRSDEYYVWRRDEPPGAEQHLVRGGAIRQSALAPAGPDALLLHRRGLHHAHRRHQLHGGQLLLRLRRLRLPAADGGRVGVLLPGGDDDAQYCRSAYRRYNVPGYCLGNLGFRLARSLP